MTGRQRALAIAAGIVLATLPFWRYAGGHGAPHTDHAPRHGGQLGMVGDHHIELVRRRGQIEVFVSDAQRRPVQPSAGSLTLDDSTTEPLRWAKRRFVAPDQPEAQRIEVVVILADGTRLALSFDVRTVAIETSGVWTTPSRRV